MKSEAKRFGQTDKELKSGSRGAAGRKAAAAPCLAQDGVLTPVATGAELSDSCWGLNR